MPLEDKAARRLVEREIARHNIDYSLMSVDVINEIAYLGGQVSALRGAMGRNIELKREIDLIVEAVGNIRGINGVVNDVKIID